MSRLISFAVLIAIIIVIGLLFYRVLIGFFIPVFLAAVLVVVFRPLHQWVLEKTGHRDQIAAVATTLLIMLALFLPITIVAVAAGIQGVKLVEQNDAPTIMLRINKVRDSLGLKMPAYSDQLDMIEAEINTIITRTEEEREESGLLTAEDSQTLKLIGAKTIAHLEQLKSDSESEGGGNWTQDFDDLIALVAQVGQPSDIAFAAPNLAVNIKSHFNKLKTELLGGSVMSIARRYANPTAQDVEETIKQFVDYVRPKLISITGATGSFFIRMVFGGVILIVAIFFFLYDGPAMLKTIMFLSPLDDAYEQELLLEFDRISRAVVLATLLSAVVQGLTAGIGYFVVGTDYLVLLIMLTTVFAMVPFVGPAVVWVPVCLYLALYEERYLAAGLLATWGVLVVGTVDNVVKAFVLHGQSQLHPLLALLSVLGGVQTLGPIGIVVGPMVVTMLQTLLGILQRELVHFEGQEFPNLSRRREPRARFNSRRSQKGSEQYPEEQDVDHEQFDEESGNARRRGAVGDSSDRHDPADEKSVGQRRSPSRRRRSRRRSPRRSASNTPDSQAVVASHDAAGKQNVGDPPTGNQDAYKERGGRQQPAAQARAEHDSDKRTSKRAAPDNQPPEDTHRPSGREV